VRSRAIEDFAQGSRSRIIEGSSTMVFRRDNKSGDAFQRQMSALRQQLGDSPSDASGDESDAVASGVYAAYDESSESDPQMPSGLSDAVARADDYRSYGEGVGAPYEGQTVTGSVTPTAPELPRLPDVDAETTVIAANTTWKGEISSEGTVHVHGRFEGSITAKDEIVVAERAEVDARLNATTVVVAGNMKGTIRCENRFEVLPTGRVTGDVQSPTLVVHEGAVVAGQVRMNMNEPAVSEPTPRAERSETPVPVIQRRANRGSA
jgi:cytoskeletal protein CcmA (bactofilin family)